MCAMTIHPPVSSDWVSRPIDCAAVSRMDVIRIIMVDASTDFDDGPYINMIKVPANVRITFAKA